MQHARLSPSGADRHQVCTASVLLIETLLARGELKESDLEDERAEQISEEEILDQNLNAYSDVVLDAGRESTSFSAEGTAMHEVRADCLVFGMDPYDFVGKTISADGFSFEIDDDMADRLVPGIDWIRETETQLHVEEQVPLDPWLPGNYGFCDTFWLVPVRGKRQRFDLYVSDYKNGVGEPVAAEGNRQLRLYALGAWEKLGRPTLRNIVLCIDQPRAGGIKDWTISFDELMAYGEETRRIYDRIERGDVEFVPSTKGCRWCPVRKAPRGCAAFNQWKLWMIGAAVMDPSDGEPKFQDPAQMPRALRYYIVQHAASIRAWLAKLHEESLQAAIDGDPDPGSKAIEGSGGRRVFNDIDAATEIVEGALGERAFLKKLIGFTELDKLMKPGKRKVGYPEEYEALQAFIDQPAPKPKLVPADHPSPAYVAPEEEFEDLGDEDDMFDDLDADDAGDL